MVWDSERLSALRQKYSGKPGETYDPRYARVAARIFKGGTRAAPFAGMPTLLSAPARAIDWSAPDFSGLDVALLGMPMDLGVTNRPGSRFGPRALRAIERIGPYNEVLDTAPVHDIAVADIGDVPFRGRFRLEQSHEDIERAVAAIVTAGVLPLSVGGDHSITHPILRAVGAKRSQVRNSVLLEALIIGVFGCMMQQQEVAEKLYKRFPFVDIVFGTNMLSRLPSFVDGAESGSRRPSVQPSASSAAISAAWRCTCWPRRRRLAVKIAHISSTAVSNTSLTMR